MTNPKRITGFMPIVAEIIVPNYPGLTAQEIYAWAEQYAVDNDLRISASATPESSLVATLHKCHKDFGLERRRGMDGRYRYYTSPDSTASEPVLPTVEHRRSVEVDFAGDRECCIEIPPAEKSKIQALVDLDVYANKHEAHRELVKKGLDSVLARLSI